MILDITKVPTESVLLAWLSPIIEQFDRVIMTQSQMDWLSPGGWETIRAIPIEIKK